MKNATYPNWSVDGVKLTMGQCMTIHVALQDFGMQMEKKNALGKDEVGESIRQGYLRNVKEINKITHG